MQKFYFWILKLQHGSFKSHSFKKNILHVVAVIVNTLLQADSDISHYSVKHIMRYAGYYQADCILLCL